MAELDKLTVRIEADMKRLKAELAKAGRVTREASGKMRRAFDSFGKSIDANLKRLVSFRGALATAAGTAGLAFMTRKAVESADAIGKTADKIGIGVEALQELRFAANLTGVSNQTLEMGLQRLGRRMGEIANFGKGEAKPAFDELGISVTHASGRLKTLEEIIPELSDGLAGITDQGRRLSIMQKLVDSESVALINTFGKGAGVLATYRKEARSTGQVLSEHLVRQSEAANDAFTRMSLVVGTNLTRVMLMFTPAMVRASEAITGFAASVVSKLPDAYTDLDTLKQRLADLRAELKEMEAREPPLFIGRGSFEGEKEAIRERIANIEKLIEAREALERLLTPPTKAEKMADTIEKVDDAIARMALETRVLRREFPELHEDTARLAINFGILEDSYKRLADGTVQLTRPLMDLDNAVRRLAEAQAQAAKTGKGWADDMNLAVDNMATAVSSRTEEAIADLMGWREVLSAFAQDIQRILLRIAVTKPLERAIGSIDFGSLLPSFGIGAVEAVVPHRGGIVGRTAMPIRAVPAPIVAYAPRLHAGLRSDEFPAILQRGEAVIPRGGGAVAPVKITVLDQRGAGAPPVSISNRVDPTGARDIVIGIMADDVRQSGPHFNAMAQALGAQRQPRSR